MKKAVLILALLLSVGGALLFFSPRGEKTIGVIIPMEHEALTQIVEGLKEELNLKDKQFKLKVLNAQGDPNILQASIESLIREGCPLLVPIGTTTSQMTLNMAKGQNVVCLAADVDLIASESRLQATALSDELSVKDSLSFLHGAMPEVKKISLIYSTSEKVAKEIPLVLEAAQSEGIEVQKLMVQNLSELYTMSRSIAADSKAIFVLKDHLIVSGIPTLVKESEKREIPVITSDEGSVLSGAAFAIGVKEADIGRQGGKIINEILNGKEAKAIAPQTMKGPFCLFINQEAVRKQGVILEDLIKEAKRKGFVIAYTEGVE